MSRERVRELAHEFLGRDDHKGWFEALYKEANEDTSHIPWADNTPTEFLVEWFAMNEINGDSKRALIVGCGLGDDAEFVTSKGFDVTAFDISSSAVEWCKKRFPNTKVNYVVADLFNTPNEWNKAFDLIVEINTLQAMPSPFRIDAMKCLPPLLADEGLLIVIARGRDEDEAIDGPPWNLSKEELQTFAREGLKQKSFEDFFDNEETPVRRFRVCFMR
jgi:predicted TPR repeat methyltransferase